MTYPLYHTARSLKATATSPTVVLNEINMQQKFHEFNRIWLWMCIIDTNNRFVSTELFLIELFFPFFLTLCFFTFSILVHLRMSKLKGTEKV